MEYFKYKYDWNAYQVSAVTLHPPQKGGNCNWEGTAAIINLVNTFKTYGVRVISLQEPWTEAPRGDW